MIIVAMAIWSLVEGKEVSLVAFEVESSTLLSIDGKGLGATDVAFIRMSAFIFEADFVVTSFLQ